MTQMISIPPEREGKPADADQVERRAQMAGALSAGLTGVTKRPTAEEQVSGVRTLRISPESGRPKAHLLMVHGGGYRIGMPEFNAGFAERLADRCNIESVLPAYRLAPENPFPAGFNDAWAVLLAMRERIGDAPLLVGGDSAGGGMAAALATYAQAQGGPRIDGTILLSPWLDMTITAASFKDNAETEELFPEASARVASETYMQGSDLRHPIASPLFAELSSFPPTFINCGTGEGLRDDSVAFHDKLEKAGVPSELSLVPDMEHVAVVRDPNLTGAAESFEAIAKFIARTV